MPLILGIESTCDETSAALVVDGRRVISNVVATQIELHAKYRGVVPEIASRAHIENILPVITQALEQVQPTGALAALNGVDAIAVANRPGLIGSLLIGVTAAKTLAWRMGKPLVGVDHVQAHLYSPMLDTDLAPEFPAIGAVLSGGHTSLYALDDFTRIRRLGHTIDDAVGEAYDKVGAILNLGYPGGPVIDKLAQTGNPLSVKFPRTTLTKDSLDFSFSGLKTSVLYHVRGYKGKEKSVSDLSPQQIADVAAAFQAACVDVLKLKILRAVKRIKAKSILIGGGVSANSGLRKALANAPVPVYFPQLKYCTDNAAMTAGLACLLLEQGRTSPLNLDAITSSEIPF